MPRSSLAPQNAIKPNPAPPAAPAPGVVGSTDPREARWANPESSCSTCLGVAPFCGP